MAREGIPSAVLLDALEHAGVRVQREEELPVREAPGEPVRGVHTLADVISANTDADVQALVRAHHRAILRLPDAAFVPLVRALGRHDFREVHALQSRELARGFDEDDALIAVDKPSGLAVHGGTT